MPHTSPTALLVLHAVRLKGFADTDAVAARFDLDAAQTGEDLLDAQAYGQVSRSSFAGLAGWSLTEAGRRHNENLLRAELDQTGSRNAVAAAHDDFLPLNAQATQAFTAWQLASMDTASPAAAGDTTGRLAVLADRLAPLELRLTGRLSRFGGYHGRFAGALARAAAEPAWITGMEVDSCHRIWFELHEDLVATLNITR
ncbi:transcriptional regulator [Catellatospora methionotrophica]|uniref:transcriptional regulator n=1 Tax=Catellatospora methionotrophica TaxID=121620 RepID=UPI0033DD1736